MTELVFIARPDMQAPAIVVGRADSKLVPRMHDTVAFGNQVYIVLQVLFDYREATDEESFTENNWMRLERVHIKVQVT